MIDLHSHSSASDGAMSPAESAGYAADRKLRVWALTDHDTVDGLFEAASACDGKPLAFVPGIEINVAWPTGEFHLLGLGLRCVSAELRATIEFLTEDRRERNSRIADMIFRDKGIRIDLKEMEARFSTSQLGRPHFARMLAGLGIVKKPQEAFDKFLGSGRPWYVPHGGEDVDAAISAIVTSGGIPVLAHPRSLYISLNKISPVIENLRSRGILGLEAFHPCVRINEGHRLEEIARNCGMFVTAGSDFHGKGVRADRHLGFTAGGLFSMAYRDAPWSWAKFMDMLPRLALVVFIVALSQTAGMIRTMRAMLLDELQKQYVITARAKGVQERKLLWKYPIRMAVNPQISTIGWILPGLIGGEMVVSIVLSMPTMGPVVRRALINQDMYLAGSFLLITSTLTVIGTLISDILLAIVDPRIKFGGVAE